MFKLKKILIIIIGMVLLLSVSSCDNNNKDVKAELEVYGLRTTVIVYAKLIDNSRAVHPSTFGVTIYDENNTSIQSHSFDETLITVQEKEFTSLKKEHTYTVKLFATFNGKKNQLSEETVVTSTLGTKENPVQIKTIADFERISKDSSAYYELKNDIDLEEMEVKPFFTESSPFKGNFNGNGYSITNFYLKQSTINNGVFGYIGSDGVVENVNFVDVTLELQRATDSNVGVVTGYNKGTIRNVVVENVSGKFTSTGSGIMNIGMFAGVNSTGIIEDSYVKNAKIETTARNNMNIAGFVAANSLDTSSVKKAIIRNCSSEFEVKFSHNLSTTYEIKLVVGGFVAINEAKIENSVSVFKFDGKTSKSSSSSSIYKFTLGGFVGGNYYTAEIRGCAAVVDVTYESTDITTANIGALVGNVVGTLNNLAIISDVVLVGSESMLQINITTPQEIIENTDEEEEADEEEETSTPVEFNIYVSRLIAAPSLDNSKIKAYILGDFNPNITNSRFTIVSSDTNNISNISSVNGLSQFVKDFINSYN